MTLDPVCLHHGKRMSEHEGGRCLYCCICFKTLKPEECVEDIYGTKWDVCKGECAVQAGIQELKTELQMNEVPKKEADSSE